MKIMLCALSWVLPLSVMAGSADAIIRGKTESGRTALEVRIGDIDGLIRSISLTVDGETLLIEDAESLPQTVVRDQENGVYFVVLNSESRVFRLWMIPKTEKVIESGNGVFRSRFAAVVEATDPRGIEGSLTPRITIGCNLDWEI